MDLPYGAKSGRDQSGYWFSGEGFERDKFIKRSRLSCCRIGDGVYTTVDEKA